MKYVLDASVALCWVIPRPLTPKALALRDDFRQLFHQLIAPSAFPAEIASGLTKAERQKLIFVGEASKFALDVLQTPPLLFPYEPLLQRAIEISSRTRSGFYDCLYVALAERENCDMVTADAKLLANLASSYPLIPLSSIP